MTQVRWSGIPISLRISQFVVIHTVKGFSIVNEAEINVILEFSFFLYDPTSIVNLIAAFSAFSKLLNLEVLCSHTDEALLECF